MIILLASVFIVLIMYVVLCAIVIGVGYVFGGIVKHVSELTGHEEKLYKPSMWFCICLAVAAFVLQFVLWYLGYGGSVKCSIAFPSSADGLFYWFVLIPAAAFLMYTIIRAFTVRYEEYATFQYITMGVSLQIAIFIFINAIASMQ